MSEQKVRTGSTEAPQSVRAGVIRRRVRWLLRVGLVLVLALVLSVVGAIRSNQRAEATPLLLAPVGPILVASGPPGWVALGGIAVIGAGVLAAEAIRNPDEDGNYYWEGAGDRWKNLLGGVAEKWNNRDADKKAETEPDIDEGTGVVVKPVATEMYDFKEGTASAGTRQVSAMVNVPGITDTNSFQRTHNVWGEIHMQCRTPDGQVHPQIWASTISSNVLAGSNKTTWTPTMTSMACKTIGTASPVPLSMHVLPMTQERWNAVGAGYPRTSTYTRDHSMNRDYLWTFKDAYAHTDGTKTTVTCESPDGQTSIIAGSARDADGVKIPSCPEGWKVKGLKMERTTPDGNVAQGVPPVEATVEGERPLSVAVDGQECVQGREGCANWSQIAQDTPERVQCLSNGQVIHTSHCAPVERFYENGGTVAHPDNMDGNPATYYDPWQEPTFKPVVQQPDGTYAPAPYRPTERPPVIAPEPWTPDPNWDPDNDPDDPRDDPTTPPAEPDPEPTYTDPYKDPSSPLYDPYQDPNNPKYDPYADPDSPLFDPDYDPSKHDPDSPNYEPEPEPTTPQEPEPEPTTPQEPEPEPTTPQEPEPEPSAEPSQDPDEDEDTDPDAEPSPEPTEVVDPDLEPGLEPGEPPYEPPPTAVGVDEWGHLLPITASVGTLSVTPSGARVYTQPDTRVATTYFPDGTKETTFTAPEVETPTGTAPMDLKTVTAPDGTKVTTGYPSVPKIETPGTLGETPTKGVHAPPEVIEGTCESTICLSIPEPPDALKTKNCIRGAYSWNPVDWVKTPVLCALREAFEPSPDKLDANVQRIKIALSARGFDILIKSFEDVVTSTPGGGGGCRGPEIAWSVSGQDFLMYPFDACSGAMANVAHYTHIFVTFAVGIFGMIGVIRNIAYGFGHRVQVGEGTESSS